MVISVFDLFSIGIGPSSSHTVGPMRASKAFIKSIEAKLSEIADIQITLYGSLAFTGVGHGTLPAILMGLCGEDPETIDPNSVVDRQNEILENKTIALLKKHEIPFTIKDNLHKNIEELLEFHSNGMRFIAYDINRQVISEEIYYSIGGGFIVKESDRHHAEPTHPVEIPYPFDSCKRLLEHCEQQNLSISGVMLENEKAWRSEAEIKQGLLHIKDIMMQSLENGLHSEHYFLPGRLKVHRRAPDLYKKLLTQGKPGPQHPQIMSWLNCAALAVNEENAAGGRVVTAPTNGAAGIIPATIYYYLNFCENANEQGVIDLLLTAGAIGILYKKNASISGAEMGCQGEVGVASSMAAGGLAAALEGSIYQVENAAEIGMEHNLGMTCDPVDGLVQIPCIERNAIGTVKAVNCAQLALAESGKHIVSLDMVIKTMREIGTNMNSIYKETSRGGLAVNVTEC